jgi:galactonate dehydratase
MRRRIGRRSFITTGMALAAGAGVGLPALARAAPRLRVTGLELLPVRATARTVWLFVRLRTDRGLTGLGEASDAFGFANTTKEDAARMQRELREFFGLVQGTSPLEIGAYRQRGEATAIEGGLVSATAYSAIEQALWDLAGKALDVPSHALFGGAIRNVIPAYANINRATTSRTPAGFASTAKAAVRDGFGAVKGAPFDGFPAPGSPAAAVEAAVQTGIASVVAMREAVGPDVEVMVDCHSFFDVPLAERVARQLEPQKLAWYEEPVAPERLEETREIRHRIQQPMAGGEILFGVRGFAPLSHDRTVNVIMPDVKHCGGLLELTRIAAVAEQDAATVQMCAVLRNFRLLEYQWGEVEWRHDIVRPAERFTDGTLRVPTAAGFGIELNDVMVRAHSI